MHVALMPILKEIKCLVTGQFYDEVPLMNELIDQLPLSAQTSGTHSL